MDDFIKKLIDLAKTAAASVPQIGAGVAIGKKIITIIDDLTDGVADPRTQDEMRAARKELAAAVSAKADKTANRLEGR